MEENNFKHPRRARRSGFIWGAVLMIAGLLFLAFNTGWFETDYKQVIFSWPMLLIVLGFINYFYRHFFSGTVFLLIGVFFILPRLALANPETFYWVSSDFTSKYWAILLVVGGILLILQCIFHPRPVSVHNHIGSPDFNKKKRIKIGTDVHYTGIERNSVFSNLEEIILDPEFTGGEMNVVFGGITLDLRKTSLPEGETIIELNAVFGGITIYIPEDWNVELHLTSVFGGFQDKRIIKGDVDGTRKLVIVGSCVFGGGEIKN